MEKINNYTENTAEMITVSCEEYKALKAQNEALKAEHETLKKENAELSQKLEWLMEQIRLSRQKRFGSSSEKSDRTYDDGSEQLGLLFNEAEVYADEDSSKDTTVSAYKRHKKHEYTLENLPEDIPVEVVEHKLSEEERVCPECGDVMSEIGKEVTRKLKLIPAKAVIIEDWYYTYACRNCEDNGISTPVIKTPKEPAIIPGSFASPEAIAHIMTQKFVMGSPLYRQEQELKRHGIPLSRQTMSNWILRAAQDYLYPVYEILHTELLKHEILHADETELQVLHEPGKKPQSKSYMWLYRTSGDTNKPIVMYEYQPDRKQDHPKEFLNGFKGYIHTDGYAVYHNLGDEITVVGCLAHARRKFDEAVKSLPKSKAKTGSAAQGLRYCNLLFEAEQGLAGLSYNERYEQRLKQEKPVLNAMFAWAEKINAAPKSALGRALTYLKEQRQYLMNYLKDGRLEISNNRAERSIKPFVIDRKNFLFANTPAGAKGSAVIFTMIQTAIENELDPYRYLTWVMRTAVTLNLRQPEDVRKLLPWNAAPECKTKVI